MRSLIAKYIVQRLSSKRVRQIEIRAPYVVATGTLQGGSRSFSNLGGAEGGPLFLGLRCEKLHAETALYC